MTERSRTVAPLSPAQWTVLKSFALEPSKRPGDIYGPTLRALLDRGLVEPCERMYFGPREERYRLSAFGHRVLDARRAARHAG
jgi:DNA-binding PadR family transcriptional regulator